MSIKIGKNKYENRAGDSLIITCSFFDKLYTKKEIYDPITNIS